MVSKIAVTALVVIVAVPILLGYAFNLTNTTITEYQPDGESVNMSQYLLNGTSYTLAAADTYVLNSKFSTDSNLETFLPKYESYTTNITALPANMDSGTLPVLDGTEYYFANYTTYSWYLSYDPSVGYLNATITLNDESTFTIQKLQSMIYDYSDNLLKYAYYTSSTTTGGGYLADAKSVHFNTIGSLDAQYVENYHRSYDTKYADISSGFHFEGYPHNWLILTPAGTQSFLLTVNLNTITSSSYTLPFNVRNAAYELVKTTTDGIASWKVVNANDPTDYVDLYYDNERSNNVYQILVKLNKTWADSFAQYYNISFNYRYVGDWPTIIGESNYYSEYSMISAEYNHPLYLGEPFLSMIRFDPDSPIRTPTMRMDAAMVSAFEYPVIKDYTYKPANFKTNPVTTIKDVKQFGTSFTFGGHTYNVDSKGYITLNTHKIPVSSIELESIPTDGGYANKINGTVVSVTVDPSTITFNGTWSANVITSAQAAASRNVTEWHAGSFAWDGIDTNFCIVGLITCLGAFIALGIYSRKRGTGGLIPLMIVVGGAAMVFFVMI